jgi:photosystem II stability/assembly factor-like uncharacterized protein
LFRSADRGNHWITLTTGLTDSNVTSLAFHPDNPDTMYLGTRNGNVFSSADGGDTWALAAHVAPHIAELKVNPFGAHEAWAIANEPGYFDTPGLYKSTDPALTTWQVVTVTEATEAAYSLIFHPNISGTLWVSTGQLTDDGYISADGGQTWQPLGAGLPSVSDFALDPNSSASDISNTILYASGAGVRKSADGGQTWQEMNQGLMGIVPADLAISPADLDEVYASTHTLGFLRSINGGRSWLKLNLPRPWGANVAIDPFTPTRVYFSSGEGGCACIRISEDQGQSWHQVPVTLPQTLAGWGVDPTIIAPNPHLAGELLAGAILYPPGSGWMPSKPGGLYASHDYGEHWDYLDISMPISQVLEIAYDPLDSQTIYVSTHDSGLLKSTDGGTSWQPILAKPEIAFSEAVAVHPYTSNIVYASAAIPEQSGVTIFLSTDAGQTWTPTIQMGPVWELSFALTEPPTLYAGTYVNGLQRYDGKTWSRAAGMPDNASVPKLATAAEGDRVVLYIGASGGVVQTGETARTNLTHTENVTKLIGSGVYRLVERRTEAGYSIYLPLILRVNEYF